MILSRATHAKRITMMGLMIGAMLLRNRVAQHTLIFGTAIAAFVILAIYAMVVARALQREGSDRSIIARIIVSGFWLSARGCCFRGCSDEDVCHETVLDRGRDHDLKNSSRSTLMLAQIVIFRGLDLLDAIAPFEILSAATMPASPTTR